MHARYQNTYNLWTSVIICSIFSPEEVYMFMVEDSQRGTDSIKQLMRRLDCIVYHWKDKEGHYRTYTLPSSKYIGAYQIKNLALRYESEVSYDDYIKSYNKESKQGLEFLFSIRIKSQFGHKPTIEEISDENLSKICNEILFDELRALVLLPKAITFAEKKYKNIKDKYNKKIPFEYSLR